MTRLITLALALALAATLGVSFIGLALSYLVEMSQAVLRLLCNKDER